MEKKSFGAIACLTGLLSCQPTESILPTVTEERVPVHFMLYLDKEVLPFPTTKGIPAFDMPEPVSMKSDTDPSTELEEVEGLCRTIEYVVYDDSQPGNILRHHCIMKEEDDFGIVYDTLPAGNYTIAFLAHSSVCEGVTDSTICFDDISDTFWKKISLPVQRGMDIRKDIMLGRVVSRIEFVAKDTVPDYLKAFHVTSVPCYDRLNIITGNGVPADSPYTLSHLFAPEERGKDGLSFGFLTFVPAPQDSLLQVTLVAEDTEGAERHRKTISSVIPLANRMVRYSGYLYTPHISDNTFSLLIDDRWGSPDEHLLED